MCYQHALVSVGSDVVVAVVVVVVVVVGLVFAGAVMLYLRCCWLKK